MMIINGERSPAMHGKKLEKIPCNEEIDLVEYIILQRNKKSKAVMGFKIILEKVIQ